LPLSAEDRNHLLSFALSDYRPTAPGQAAGDVVTIGTDDQGAPVTLDRATRNKHLYLIGKSRTGKTTLMLNLMRADLAAGDGFTFIDPAGDAAHQLLGYVPQARADAVTYFDPTRDDCPALNLFALPYDRDKLMQEILSVFALFFNISPATAPRMYMLLRYGLLALLDDRTHEPHSLADLERLYLDDHYRATIADRATDERVRRFLTDDLPRFKRADLDPVINKLDAFLSTRTLARLFGTTTNALDFDALLNRRGVLICSLSKGKIGEEPAKFLGGLIVAALTVAALARANQPPATRVDHFLYVDEFQNFAVDSFATIFAEAAKYRLNLCVAHQTRAQLTPEIHAAIGNASTYVVFRVSADDAAALARELHTKREADDMYSDSLRQLAAALPVAARGVLREPTRVHWHTLFLKVLNPTIVPGEHRRAIEAADDWRRRRNADRARENVHQLRLAHATFGNIERQRNPAITRPTTTWPTPNDITNLENLHAFARIERPENTTTLTVPFPPPDDATTEAARAAVLARIHARAVAAEKIPTNASEGASRAETEALKKHVVAEPLEKNRPHQTPQDRRSPAPEAQPTHEKSTKTPVDDSDDFLT
jgi:hypothetical protein